MEASSPLSAYGRIITFFWRAILIDCIVLVVSAIGVHLFHNSNGDQGPVGTLAGWGLVISSTMLVGLSARLYLLYQKLKALTELFDATEEVLRDDHEIPRGS